MPPEGSPQAAALKTFWGLGDRWWEQFIDGKFHCHRSMVFDRGLHRSLKESGYLQSLLIGAQFAADHLGEPLTLDFYKGLHRNLCQHFQGKSNNTLMNAEEAGEFRNVMPICSVSKIKNLSTDAAYHYLIISDFMKIHHRHPYIT